MNFLLEDKILYMIFDGSINGLILYKKTLTFKLILNIFKCMQLAFLFTLFIK